MKQLLLSFVVTALLLISCKKEESAPGPAPWSEDWCVFRATVIHVNSDTTQVAFSSNQGYFCTANVSTQISLIPWQSEAVYRSQMSGAPGIKFERGKLYFNGVNWNDVPEDSAFIDYFHSGYYPISPSLDSGFNITYTDPQGGVYSTSAYAQYFGTNYTYTCRISDTHPFVQNGMQLIKVRMNLDGILLSGGPSNSVIQLDNVEYEGFFRNY